MLHRYANVNAGILLSEARKHLWRQIVVALTFRKEGSMLKAVALIGLGAVLVVIPSAVWAEQGTSSSFGTVGWGPIGRAARMARDGRS
jgi:hypothetical protein